MMTSSVVLLTVLPVLVQAFSNTVPVAVWTSTARGHLNSNELPESATALVDSVISSSNICNHDAVLFVDSPGLHASDLRTLPSSSAILKSIQSSSTSVQFPYLENSMVPLDVPAAAQSVSDRCGSRLLHVSPGWGSPQAVEGDENKSKHVICLNMPHMHSDHPNGRPGIMQEHDTLFSMELEKLKSLFPNHLVILAGTPSSNKRQGPHTAHPSSAIGEEEGPSSGEDDLSTPPTKKPIVHVSSSGGNSDFTVPKDAGILKKYQILTPGLILSLIVAFGLLIPAALLGFNALASVQSPVSVSPAKGFDAMAKKNQ